MADFGIDLSCLDDMTDGMREVSGSELMQELVYRMLTTPKGSLIDDPNWGIDLSSYLHKGMTQAEIQGIPSIVRATLLADQRILECSVDSVVDASRLLTLKINAVAASGPFELTIGVSELTVEMLRG